MGLYEQKNCRRCTSTFECKPGNIANCQCTQVQITVETRKYLENTDYGCLCKNCLTELDKLVKLASHHSFPRQGELMLENLHYYKENGKWVFTEFYHLLRGSCCQNGCRHCAYGFTKNQKD